MKLHIGMISDHASPLAPPGGTDSGGQNVYVSQTARYLARRGHRVDVFTRRDDSRLPEVLYRGRNLRVIHVPAGPPVPLPKEGLLSYMPDFSHWMQRWMMRAEEACDLVHAHFWMSGLVAAELKERLGIPYVTSFHALGTVRRNHQGDLDRFPPERMAIEKRIVQTSDRVIASCPQEFEDLVRYYDAEPHRMARIPCGVDPGEMRPLGKRHARWRLGIPEHHFIAMHVGRMVPRKGIDNVVRGFARFLRCQSRPAALYIVGGDSEAPDPRLTPEIGVLSRLAESEGVSHAVHFVGRRDREKLKLYYSAADVFLTTPWYEPFGITPLEAMACGTPVIASEVGGLKYTVCHQKTGFLVSVNHAEALEERLLELSLKPDLRTQMGRIGRRRTRALFRWSRVTHLLEEVYHEVTHDDL